MGRWVREPLLHFLAVGVLVFALQWALGDRPAPDDSHLIVVDEALREELNRQLWDSYGRSPSSKEIEAEVDRWVDIEILVREAERLGLDREDPVIRERLAAKMSRVHAALEQPLEPSDEELRELWEQVESDFVFPARVTLRQLFAEDEEAARALAVRWEAGEDPRTLPGEPPPGGPVLRGRTSERLVELFGQDFADAVQGLEVEDVVVLESSEGWHAVQIQERQEAQELSFEEARDRLVVRWKTEQARATAAGAAEDLRSRYEVRR